MRPIPLDELSGAQVRAWARLAEEAIEPNPYLHPEFVLPAARAAGALSGVGLLVTGAWSACLPVRAERRWSRLPLPGTHAWLHDQCFLGTPLVAPGDPEGAMAGLLRDLAVQRGCFGRLDLTDTAGPVGEAIAAALPAGAVSFGGFERAALRRRPEPDYLEGRLSGKHRRAQRRLGRDLEAELGGELRLIERAGSEDAVNAFLELEGAGWKGTEGTALKALPGGGEFLRSMCRDFAARGALQLLFLEAGDHVVAARLNLRAGGVILCFKIAHDEELRRFSPGMQLELRMIDHFHADPTAEWMDSCADPGSEMFGRLWADTRALGGVLVPRRGVTAPVVRRGLRAVAGRIDRRTATR